MVCCSIVKVNGIQNLRYPTRVEHKQWRFGKRQDQLPQPRFFLWKSALTPGQLYPNTKTPVLLPNYNRYGMPPAMAPMHQNYMFTIPTKVNYPPYQPLKEIDEKRNPGNLHHITIINAIIPKPYVPTPPTYSHPTTTFRNYRNNKLLYHQYLNNNYGRQNMENYNKIKTQQQQLHKQQLQLQQQHSPAVYQNVQNTIPAALMVNNKPTMEYINLISYTTSNNNNNNNYHENKINNASVANCGRRAKEDSTNNATNVLYYYCNNRILNYKNPSEKYIESTQPITTTTPKSTTSSTKSSRLDLDFYTTEKSVFLPTPYTPLESSSSTVVLTTPSKANRMEYNFVPTMPTLQYDTKYDSTKLQQHQQRYTTTTTTYDDFKRPQLEQRHTPTTYNEMKRQQQRYTSTKYDDMKRQQQRFTTASYDDMKLHSFFTIEDAVTSAPQMQVFNDPYQAYRHARKQHNYHQRHTTTTKKPIVTTTTKKSTFKSFFDDFEDEVYVTPDSRQYDYSFFGQPQKSTRNVNGLKFQLPTSNQIVDHTHKPEMGDSFYGESYQGKAKIKEHHFGIFNAITPTTTFNAPFITTYKPNNNLSDISFTTQNNYKSQPLTYSTTTEIRLRNTEHETTTPFDIHDVSTSTLATTTTTAENKPKRMPTKSPLNLRSTVSFQFPKHRGLYKPIKNLTSTSTSSTRTPPLKKVIKYQRQYKGKKLKQFKHLYTTSSSLSSSLSSSSSSSSTTTTTITPKIEVYHPKRAQSRTFPTTSTTETATTRKIISRTSSTTETTKPRKLSTRFTSTTESSNVKKASSRTLSSTEASYTKKSSLRRGSKRANKSKEKEDSLVLTTKRIQNKRRRKPQTTSTTAKSTVANTPSISTHSYILSSTLPTILARTSSTTTMKSIMRIANSKVRSQIQNDIKPNAKLSNEVYDDLLISDDRVSLKSITSAMAKEGTVPSLPIEIYFKKSHIAQI